MSSIEATGLDANVINVTADGVVIGRRDKGFTVRGGIRGILVDGHDTRIESNDIAGATVAGITTFFGTVATGNYVHDNGPVGLDVQGTGNTLTAIGGFSGVDAVATTGAVVTGNSVRAAQTGIFVGDHSTVDGNVVDEGIGAGINAEDTIGLITDNYLLGNRDGIVAFAGSGEIRRNTIAGNIETGILFAIGEYGALAVAGHNIFANDPRPESQSCGVTTAADQVLDLERNYWGSASGPGLDPADAVCVVSPGVPPDTTPFATRPFAINNSVGR